MPFEDVYVSHQRSSWRSLGNGVGSDPDSTSSNDCSTPAACDGSTYRTTAAVLPTPVSILSGQHSFLYCFNMGLSVGVLHSMCASCMHGTDHPEHESMQCAPLRKTNLTHSSFVLPSFLSSVIASFSYYFHHCLSSNLTWCIFHFAVTKEQVLRKENSAEVPREVRNNYATAFFSSDCSLGAGRRNAKRCRS